MDQARYWLSRLLLAVCKKTPNGLGSQAQPTHNGIAVRLRIWSKAESSHESQMLLIRSRAVAEPASSTSMEQEFVSPEDALSPLRVALDPAVTAATQLHLVHQIGRCSRCVVAHSILMFLCPHVPPVLLCNIIELPPSSAQACPTAKASQCPAMSAYRGPCIVKKKRSAGTAHQLNRHAAC